MTLIELMVVISVVTILIAIAVPSFKGVTDRNRVSTELNGLVGDIQFARSEAIKEGITVVMCATNNGSTCATTTNWYKGWMVFNDLNGNGQYDSSTETIYRTQKQFVGSDTLVSDQSINKLTFNREGFISGLPGTVTFKAHNAANTSSVSRCVAVAIGGVLTAQAPGTGNCS